MQAMRELLAYTTPKPPSQVNVNTEATHYDPDLMRVMAIRILESAKRESVDGKTVTIDGETIELSMIEAPKIENGDA